MKLKRIFSTVLVLALLLGIAPLTGIDQLSVLSSAAETYSGKCGENLTWTLDTTTGELVISGTGAMYNWSETNVPPWYYRGEYISSVTIGEGITTIGKYAFCDRDNIKNVTIGSSVTDIGDYAFQNCDGLTTVTIPDSVINIGIRAFEECVNLVELKIGNGVIGIGEKAFRHCEKLTNVIIPDNVTYLGKSAFQGCTSLESLKIGSGITVIRETAFNYCPALTKVTIPHGIKVIQKDAFYACYALTSVIFSDSVTDIGERAFGYCEKLEEMYVGSGVTAIGPGAFDSSTGITDIYYGGSQAEWEEIAFGLSNDSLFSATMHFNHVHGSSVSEVTPPTCTEQGYTTHTCECGYTYISDYVNATGHNFLDGKCAVCGEEAEKLSSIQSITYVQQEDTHKTFTVTCNDRASMIQFMEPDGGTRTYDRYNKNVTITGYNAQGEKVSSMSRDLAYEVWEIYTNLSVGTTVKLRAKFNSKWEADKRTLFVDEYNPVISMELSATSGKKGAVPATVVADEKTEKVMFKMPNGTSVTVAASGKDENGNNIFTGKAWMNEDGVNIINVFIRRDNVWKSAGTLEYTVE